MMFSRYLYRQLLCFIAFFVGGLLMEAQHTTNGPTDDQTLQELFALDQGIRETLDSLILAQAPTEELLPLYQQMAQQDLENQKRALPILDRHLAGHAPLSHESLNALYYIIQHAHVDIQLKYQQFVRKVYEQNIISNMQYGMFIDRLHVKQNKAQRIGSQCFMDIYTQDRFLYPISSDAEKYRKRLGLEDAGYDVSLSNEYAPLYVSPSEFVLFGHALRRTGDQGEYEGVPAVISAGKIRKVTNRVGFFALKLKKKEVPDSLDFFIDGEHYTQPVNHKKGTDWEIVSCIVE